MCVWWFAVSFNGLDKVVHDNTICYKINITTTSKNIQERFTFLFLNGSVPCDQFLRGKSRIGQESCMWSSRKQQSISIVLDLLKHWFKHHQVSNKPISQHFPNMFHVPNISGPVDQLHAAPCCASVESPEAWLSALEWQVMFFGVLSFPRFKLVTMVTYYQLLYNTI